MGQHTGANEGDHKTLTLTELRLGQARDLEPLAKAKRPREGDARQARDVAARVLTLLGYSVGVDETRVVQNGTVVAAPSAPHFLWHELGHALAYLGDEAPRTPLAGWFPEPEWVEKQNLPEWQSDQFADVFAYDVAALFGFDRVPGARAVEDLPSVPDTIRERIRERVKAVLASGQPSSGGLP
jgi:hypothetical protein